MAYDALGRCVKRTLSGGPTTYYGYDGDKPIVEYDSSGASAGVNVYGKGVDEILERVAIGADGQWHTYYLHQNHEGSVTLLTDTSGNALERYRYDVFGAPTIYAPNWISRSATLYDNRFLFTGSEPSEWGHREMDGQAREGNGRDERERTSQYAATYRSTHTTAAFNFYEYRARAYNAKLGRFMSEDPKLFDAGDYNLFRYCHNDPVDNVDPMGLADEKREPWYNHQEQARMADEHVSASQAVWNRQMNMSSSYGGIAYGIAGYNQQQVNQVSISARTDIRGSFQSGAKTVQNVSLSASGELKSLGNYVGYTNVFGVPIQGYGQFGASANGSFPIYNVNMKATAVAAPIAAAVAAARLSIPALRDTLPLPKIHYDINVKVNFASRMASLSGIHSAFPSFSVRIGGRPLYNYQERFFMGGLLPVFDRRSYVRDTEW